MSSSQSKDNLKSQVKRLADYCAAKGYPITHEVSEIGSGLNDSRRKLLRLFDQDDWSVLVVEHKDRLTRFGFRYLERLAAAQDRKIEVINATDDDTDLMGDLVSVITSFCARIYGHRRSKRRTEKIIAEMSAHD